MISKQTAKYSLRHLRKKKARSFFTILSILMGISTMFIFISYGLGLYKYVNDLTQGSSADKLLIQAAGGTFAMLDNNVQFDEDDIAAIERVPGVYEVSGTYFRAVEVKSQDRKIFTFLISYDPGKPIVMESSNIKIEKGRELSGRGGEVLLGYNYGIDGKIFPNALRINQNIEVNRVEMKVIGFYEEVGSPQDDAQVYIDNKYFEEVYQNESLSYNMIVAKVDLEDIDDVKEKVKESLRRERDQEPGKEDFYVQSFDDLISGFSSALSIVLGFIILIALISVLVSAVNTSNTMITSVLERVQEIGIIKSIGARNSDIFGIFLFESSFLGLIAGIVGVLIGWGLSSVGAALLSYFGYGFLKPSFPLWLFISCIAFATITGGISGVWPASNASKINPVEALRYE